jgi:hypothetical protein
MKSVNTDMQHDERRLEGFFCLLATAFIVFIVTVPLFAYLSYRRIQPAFLLTLIALGIPCAMLLAQKYVAFLRHLYGTKYTQFTVSLGGSAIAKELDLRLLLFDLVPTEALNKELQMMERLGLLKRKRDWLPITGDAALILGFGVGIYFTALSFQLDAHFFPIYAGVVACIIFPVLLPRSRERYAWSRMRYKYHPNELQRKLFDSLYTGFVSRLSPRSHEMERDVKFRGWV